MEIPGGWGGPPTTLWNGNSRGVGGFKLKNHAWGGMDIFWNHTMGLFHLWQFDFFLLLHHSQSRLLFKHTPLLI